MRDLCRKLTVTQRCGFVSGLAGGYYEVAVGLWWLLGCSGQFPCWFLLAEVKLSSPISDVLLSRWAGSVTVVLIWSFGEVREQLSLTLHSRLELDWTSYTAVLNTRALGLWKSLIIMRKSIRNGSARLSCLLCFSTHSCGWPVCAPVTEELNTKKITAEK